MKSSIDFGATPADTILLTSTKWSSTTFPLDLHEVIALSIALLKSAPFCILQYVLKLAGIPKFLAVLVYVCRMSSRVCSLYLAMLGICFFTPFFNLPPHMRGKDSRPRGEKSISRYHPRPRGEKSTFIWIAAPRWMGASFCISGLPATMRAVDIICSCPTGITAR